jgi:hypothetical protein
VNNKNNINLFLNLKTARLILYHHIIIASMKNLAADSGASSVEKESPADFSHCIPGGVCYPAISGARIEPPQGSSLNKNIPPIIILNYFFELVNRSISISPKVPQPAA